MVIQEKKWLLNLSLLDKGRVLDVPVISEGIFCTVLIQMLTQYKE